MSNTMMDRAAMLLADARINIHYYKVGVIKPNRYGSGWNYSLINVDSKDQEEEVLIEAELESWQDAVNETNKMLSMLNLQLLLDKGK